MTNKTITFEAALGGAELTRAYAIRFASLAVVNAADEVNCDFTNRVMNNDSVELNGSVNFIDRDGDERTLTAYYYQDASDVADYGDISSLKWDVDHYKLSQFLGR